MADLSFGNFKVLENGLGLGGVSTPSYSFMDSIGSGLKTLGGYANKGLSFLNDNSQAIGALGGLYGAYSQNEMANKMYNLQRDAYNYNKTLSEREKKRQEDAEQAIALGFANSNLSKV